MTWHYYFGQQDPSRYDVYGNKGTRAKASKASTLASMTTTALARKVATGAVFQGSDGRLHRDYNPNVLYGDCDVRVYGQPHEDLLMLSNFCG